MKKNKQYIIIFALIFVVYNIIVFVAGGFSGHSAAFWISYIFEIFSFISIAAALSYMVSKEQILTKIVFLGYPIIAWSAAFLFIQTIISTIFMILDNYAKVGLIIQIIILAGYITIILLCHRTEEIITDIQETRTANISNMKNLTAEINIISNLEMDIEVKKAVTNLADKFMYSDIVSSESTQQIEQQLISEIKILKSNCKTNPQLAMELINQIEEHLNERNIICKNSKQRF